MRSGREQNAFFQTRLAVVDQLTDEYKEFTETKVCVQSTNAITVYSDL